MMICDPEVACILVYLGEREQEVSMRDILDAKPRSEWLQLIQQWIHNETDRPQRAQTRLPPSPSSPRPARQTWLITMLIRECTDFRSGRHSATRKRIKK